VTRVSLILVLLALAGVLPASVAAVPPSIHAHIAVTHTRPVAGKVFTGLTATPADERIATMTCDSTIGRKTLRGRLSRFYASGVAGPAAVTCGWKIPPGAHGTLSVQADVTTAEGSTLGISQSWRVKH
jgi:hypothetical protein